MSRGLGEVQLSLIAALEAQPNRHFTVIELAQATSLEWQSIGNMRSACAGRLGTCPRRIFTS
jgi:hypothetical protein